MDILIHKLQLTAVVVFMVSLLATIMFPADQVPDWLKVLIIILFAGSGLIAAGLTVYKIWA